MNKLFVYGIFLDERNRLDYGMTNPKYDTVDGYITVGHIIVKAVKAPTGCSLTGLVVDIDPSYWGELDALEGGYDRITVTTNSGIEAYMYVGRERHGK